VRLHVFLDIVELRTKIVSVSGFLLASLGVLHERGRVDPIAAAVLFAAVLAVDMGTTAFNSYFDYLRGVDELSRNREKDKVLVHEGVPPAAALAAALLLFAFAAIAGIGLAAAVDLRLLPLGAACFLVAFLYSGGPRPISSTPFGELFAGLFLGSALFLVVALALGGDPAAALLRSLPSAFCVAAILSVNNACDREGDRAAGRRTAAVLFGKAADALPALLFASGYAAAAALALAGKLPSSYLFAASSGAVLSAIPLYGMYRRGFSHATKGPNMGAVSRAFLIFTISSAAAFLCIFTA